MNQLSIAKHISTTFHTRNQIPIPQDNTKFYISINELNFQLNYRINNSFLGINAAHPFMLKDLTDRAKNSLDFSIKSFHN